MVPRKYDLVMVIDAVEPEIYDVRPHLGRAGRVTRLSPWCGQHMVEVQFIHGDKDHFFYEELCICKRDGVMLASPRMAPLPLP